MSIQSGQKLEVYYEGRNFEVIVIDPNGIGPGQPSVGLGFRMLERYSGLPQPTLSNWLEEGDSNIGFQLLKTPSGKDYRVIQISGLDGNDYSVIEVSDWMALVVDVLKKPGKIRKGTKDKLLDFLGWFAVKGFYADAYTALKGVYTAKDSRVLSNWMEARLSGIHRRNDYTDFLQAQGCTKWDYAYWTDYVYKGLFDRHASDMRRLWKVVEGNKRIARNYVPEVEGLKAVAYCERMVIDLHVDSLEQAHDDAISFTKRKFFGGQIAGY